MFELFRRLFMGEREEDFVLNNQGLFDHPNGRCGAYLDGNWCSWPARGPYFHYYKGQPHILWGGKFYAHSGQGRWKRIAG